MGRAVSCQPIATPIRFDQNAIHNSAGMACLLCGSNLRVNVLSLLRFLAIRGGAAAGRILPIGGKYKDCAIE